MPITNENSDPVQKLRSRKELRSTIGCGAVKARQKNTAPLNAGNDQRSRHRPVLEPVLRGAFLERIFDRAEKPGHRGQTRPIETRQQRIVRLVEVDQQPAGDGDDDARRNVDQEQPMPGEEIGQIAADRRADRRRERRDQADDRADDRLLAAREDREGRGEHRRDHAAADEALQRPPDDHLVDR